MRWEYKQMTAATSNVVEDLDDMTSRASEAGGVVGPHFTALTMHKQGSKFVAPPTEKEIGKQHLEPPRK